MGADFIVQTVTLKRWTGDWRTEMKPSVSTHKWGLKLRADRLTFPYCELRFPTD